MSPARVAAAVLATELRALLRDRRALFLGVVLPMLLFPALFLGMDELERGTKASLAERELGLGLDLGALEPGLAARVRDALAAEELRLEREPVALEPAAVDRLAAGPAGPGEERPSPPDATLLERPAGHRLHALLVGLDSAEAGAPPLVLLVHDGSSSLGNEARRRVSAALEALAHALRLERLEALVGGDPAAPLALEVHDLAPPEDAAGHRLGGLLPMILVLILVSGGSFAALGAFAAEREEGTLETLLVQPVPSLAIASGKFLAVLATALVAAAGNGASFLATVALGLGEARGLGAELALGTGAGRLALGLALFLPTAVLLSGVLCLVSARARSFREGQHYVFPIVLVGALLAAAASQDRVPASLLLALVPVTGPTLVLRDTLAGALPVGPAVVATLASSFYAWLCLARLADTLDAERLLGTDGGEAEATARHAESRAAVRWGLAAVALVYVVGGWLQGLAPIAGLVGTLVLLVPGLALLAARGGRRRSGEGWTKALGLVTPLPSHLAGALLVAPGLTVLLRGLLELQSRVLPLPEGLLESEALAAFEALPPWALVGLLAVLPGLFEELLFRGALLRRMAADLAPRRVVLWQALLFGAVHASLHRFLPTAAVGALLAAVTLRARSLWPAVLLHAGSNGLLVLAVHEEPWWSDGLALVAAGVGGALLLLRRSEPAESSEPEARSGSPRL